MSKKIEEPIKLRKPKKKKPKKPNREKKPIKILNKQIGSVRFDFGFIRLKLKKLNRIEPKQKKPEKTEPNRFEPVFVQKNWTELKSVGLNRFRFEPISVFLKFFWFGYFFLIKTEPNRKWSPLVAGPVQGSGFGFWPGHRIARVNSFFKKKNQNDIVLVKNKTQRVATEFLTGLARSPGHTGFFLPIFFL